MTVKSDSSIQPFDRPLLRQRRLRARKNNNENNVLSDEVGQRLIEDLQYIRREFHHILNLGDPGLLGRLQFANPNASIIMQDILPFDEILGGFVVAEEDCLPYAIGSFDLVVSNLALQNVNDIPGCLVQLRRCLKPDGLLLASMLGGESLLELRQVLLEAEIAVTGGAAARLIPLPDFSMSAGLLQRADLAMPVVHQESLTLTFKSMFELIGMIRRNGYANFTVDRAKKPLRRDVLLKAAELYAEKFSTGDGRITANIQIIYLSGWAPSANQPQPLTPGSAQTRLADALGAAEISTGEKTGL